MTRLRVLAVDDNVPILRALKRALGDSDVIAVHGLVDAQLAMQSEVFDVVLADYQLDGPTTGIDILELAQSLCPDALRILGSAHAHILDGLRRGPGALVDAALAKPFARADLDAALKEARAFRAGRPTAPPT